MYGNDDQIRNIQSEDVINELGNEKGSERMMNFEDYVNQTIELDGKVYYVSSNNEQILLQEIAMEGQDQMALICENSEMSYDMENGDLNTVMIEGKQYIVNNDQSGYITYQEVNKINYVCPESGCHKRFNQASSLTKHVRDVHYSKVFVCRQCPQIFPDLSDLFLHARQDHADPKKIPKDPSKNKFHCKYPNCSYMTNNGGTFEHHLRAHDGVKPYMCDLCGKTFTQNANMKTHRSRHVSDKVFSCNICKKDFKTHDILLAHLRTREHELREHVEDKLESSVKVVCLGCNEHFNKMFDIRNHLKSCNQKLDTMLKCLSCQSFVSDFDELKTHIKGHKETMQITCPMCSLPGFANFHTLNLHITRSHNVKVARRNVCRYCETTFDEEFLLIEHIRDYHADDINSRKSHGIIGRFQCPFPSCNFTANTDMLIQSHINQHETGKLDMTLKPVPLSPKKRGRKRKILDGSIMFDVPQPSKKQEPVNQESVNLELVKQEFFPPQFVKRGRGRPRKVVDERKSESTPKELVLKIDDEQREECLDTQFDYVNLAEAFFENETNISQVSEEQSEKKKRGRPRKVMEDCKSQFDPFAQSDSIAINVNSEFSVEKSHETYLSYIKCENDSEITDPDCLYV